MWSPLHNIQSRHLGITRGMKQFVVAIHKGPASRYNISGKLQFFYFGSQSLPSSFQSLPPDTTAVWVCFQYLTCAAVLLSLNFSLDIFAPEWESQCRWELEGARNCLFTVQDLRRVASLIPFKSLVTLFIGPGSLGHLGRAFSCHNAEQMFCMCLIPVNILTKVKRGMLVFSA
ncbi:hypothetical protein GBA52_029120 [Prunus armeniaca]|nr:hypothetical protein GBA52_029120 [Prunus armeniaca]